MAAPALPPGSPALAWRVEWLDVAGSTNDLLLERARRGEAEGLVIAARSQLRGRGRRGRAWHSPPGAGLYFSALLRPPKPPAEARLLTLLAGVAAAEGLSSLAGPPVGLKWPNDLRVHRKKLGGILCEYEPQGGPPPAVVAGVGVNLTGEETDFPAEIRGRATSLRLAGKAAPEAEETLSLLLRHLDFWYKVFLNTGFEPVRTRWMELCDNLGEEAAVSAEGETLRGKVAGIDGSGRLLLQGAEGRLLRAEAGEVIET
ncbi:MAG: biotin--[acetyl-CoA-carboxylase] ligase [Candidatus Tectomicrobia bacterium]|uniref:biotin--[biotin carboxyl-carrier protein] ligase n=1 Tax=Tectimicrobiota bacterium TaxID=2528274 RepID=A0A932ZU68_UNCTE|nr:biotin--[acetyl-CoA-carboxylase] ligase [Candidatus Tectomicrobia bacterium]